VNEYRRPLMVFGVLAAGWALFFSCRGPRGSVLDEARRAGRSPESLVSASEDYFHEMDSAQPLTAKEINGRNTWLVWTGGNDRLWDVLSTKSVGTLDFLKTVSSYDPGLDSSLSPEQRAQLGKIYKYGRSNRFAYLGLINEPCFDKPKAADPRHFGLWLDQRRSDCPPDPFEDAKKYTGVAVGARGANLPVGSLYGEASGIVGLRLFANPDFDEAAAKRWDPKRYYTDPSYYNAKDLIRPYRVGMSCGFCHVGPNPIKPPADPEKPSWANLSSNVGAQYFWVDRIFSWQGDPSSYVFQLFHSARPGTLDTSLISTDYINNPRTMNAVYAFGGRLEDAKRWGKETLAGGSLNNKQFNDYVSSGPLTQFFQPPATVLAPNVLKDGSDSVGILGALNRVYLNIGLFSEEWLLHFNALAGGKRQTPLEIKVARENSSYWNATERQAPDLARFFLKSATPHHLKDAPSGADYLTDSEDTLREGKRIFADNCARCHSSKAPDASADANLQGCVGAGYLGCWSRYWKWTKTDEFRAKMRAIVEADDFLNDNFLSTDLRVPVTLLGTNACSPLASNAIAGNIWDNFSSQTYKELPSVGTIEVVDPFTGEPRKFQMPAGGRGYTRPASLVSLWSSAPFLLNNSVGSFSADPSVKGRMASFQDAIEQMLWPERRPKDSVLGAKSVGLIDRTTQTSYLRVPAGYLPDGLRGLLSPAKRWLPMVFGDDGIELGPIPSGTPVSILSGLQLTSEDAGADAQLSHDKKVLELLLRIKNDLESLKNESGDVDGLARKAFANLVPRLLQLSACPDFVVNKGHYFGTDRQNEEPPLSDAEKRALIAFLKTF